MPPRHLHRRIAPPVGGDTSIRLNTVFPSSSTIQGGVTVTLHGYGFRYDTDGSAPLVTFSGLATIEGITKQYANLAADVVVVDASTITCTVPAVVNASIASITVVLGSNVGALYAAFTYYTETFSSIDPKFGPISGGNLIHITGYNFNVGQSYRVLFGTQDATQVTVYDSNTIGCIAPANAVGFVDVTLLGTLAVLTHGYQYTLLVRGTDIRRNPGTTINTTLGAPPSTANFTIDGNSSQPQGGEKITCIDAFDNNRLLFAGTVQKVKQVYEGLITQLAWEVEAVDFTWLANSKRPIGSWFQVSASQVVAEIVAKFAPGFTTNFVQTNLAKVTIVLDGSMDLISVLNMIAKAIGGGHWYVDYKQDFHFFHILPKFLATGVPIIPPTGGDVTPASYITLATGGVISSTDVCPAGYYAIRVQNIYDDGTSTSLSPWSNLVLFDGRTQFSLSAIPLGATISGKVCIRRRLWYHAITNEDNVKISDIRAFCDITDNTTTAFTSWFGALNANSSAVAVTPINAIGTKHLTDPSGPLRDNGKYIVFTVGGMVPGVYDYVFTLSSGLGETLPSPRLSIVLTALQYGQDVDWASLYPNGSIPAGTTSINIYRTAVNDSGGVLKYVGRQTDLHNYTYTDTLIDSARTHIPSVSNTTVDSSAADTVVVPDGSNQNNPAGPTAAPSARLTGYYNANNTDFWQSGYFQWRTAFLYRDGSISYASPATPSIGNAYLERGWYIIATRLGLAIGPNINTNTDCIARFVYTCGGWLKNPGFTEPSHPGDYPPGYGQGNPNYALAEPTWNPSDTDRNIVVVPDNTTLYVDDVRRPLFDTGIQAYIDAHQGLMISQSSGDLVQPVIGNRVGHILPVLSGSVAGPGPIVFPPDPVPQWPNTDGPYLEDTDPPDPIDDDNTSLLYGGDSGSTPFSSNNDLSQIRNRIFVIGSGSTLTLNYVPGSLLVQIADAGNFALAGGTCRVYNPATGLSELAKYSGLSQSNGTPYVNLVTPLSYAYTQGSLIYNYYQADDLDSQKFFAKFELDAFGRPTDGVHEYTIVDGSLKTVWQMYMRAQAELELYSRPIVTINYSTRDPKSKIGQTVHVDLTNPPCKGDFLLQTVTIDQVRDDGDDIAPRYTVRASSVRYELDDLLLKILDINAATLSISGIAAAGTAGDGTATTTTTNFPISLPLTAKAGRRWDSKFLTSSFAVGSLNTLVALGQTGVVTNVLDVFPGVGGVASQWTRYTPNASNSNLCGWNMPAVAPWDLRPKVVMRFRTAPLLNGYTQAQVLANVRRVYWFVLSNTEPSAGLTALLKPHIGVVCESVSNGSAAFRWTTGVDGGQNIGPTIGTMFNNTVYTIMIEFVADTMAKITITNETLGTSTVTSVAVSNLLAAQIVGSGTTDKLGLYCYGTGTGVNDSLSYLDIHSVYYECD